MSLGDGLLRGLSTQEIFMKLAFTLFFLSIVLTAVPSPSFAGPCDHSWQTASDGSRCGDRAADRREGGD